ncbi:MAG: hypothetical protein IJN76_04050 [Clostridia bacterium]|nr:hypothetical protein [Clostridia bacterium]
MLLKEFAQAKKELASVERNTWIQAYISRRENPIILVLYFLTVSIGSFVFFEKYFATGIHFSIGLHLVVLVAFPIVLRITRSILNALFRKKAMRCCPVESPSDEIDVQLYNNTKAYLAETKAMLAEYNRLKGLTYPGLSLIPYSLLTPVIFLLWFGYFAWFQQLAIPEGCVLYLVILSIVFLLYSPFVVAVSSQLLDIPLSYEVKESLEKLEKHPEKRQSNPTVNSDTSSDTSSDVSWYIQLQKENEEYFEKLHEWATNGDDPTPGAGDGI